MKTDRPLKELLDPTTDEARIARMWAVIRARREPRRAPIAALALAAVALLAVGAGALLLRSDGEGSELRLASGALPRALDGEGAARFEDGSSIELSAGARVEAIENGRDRFVLLLARGSARFSVTPGGPRRWVVESGLATVEVVGTVFTVSRGDEGVEVRVERGVVLVRGERVPDRVRRLTAGRSIVVSAAPDAIAAAREESPREAPERDEVGDRAGSAEAEAHPRGGPATLEPAREARAPRPPPRGEAPAADDPIELALEQADEARRRGDPHAAVQHLRRAAAAEGDRRAAIAAFTLGRVELDELHRPDRARAAFERALALGLPEHLAAHARRRIEEIDAREPSP